MVYICFVLSVLYPCSLLSVYMDYFHNFLMTFLLGLFVFMGGYVIYIFSFYGYSSSVFSKHFVELFFVLSPSFFVGLILWGSLLMLYSFVFYESSPLLSVKVDGHQWYWGYNFSDFDLSFDSFMSLTEDMGLNSNGRLTSVDPLLILPTNTLVRFCMYSSDVIHSWALPSIGIKFDCNPGMFSVVISSFPLLGLFDGGCSELCGAGHSFMPIEMGVTTFVAFIFWLKTLV